MVFGLGPKERLTAAHALVRSRVLRVFIFAGKRRFGPLLPGHKVLIRRQLPLPLPLILAHLFAHHCPPEASSKLAAPCYQIRHLSPRVQLSRTRAPAERTICGGCYPPHFHLQTTPPSPSLPDPPPQSHSEICFHSRPHTSFLLRTSRSRKLSCPRTAAVTRSHASIRRETDRTRFRRAHSLRNRSAFPLRPERIPPRPSSSHPPCP